MRLTKKMAFSSLRPNQMPSLVESPPSEKELQDEIDRLKALPEATQKETIKSLRSVSDPIEIHEVEDRLEAIENKDSIGIFTLDADQALSRSVQNIVLFSRFSDGVADALSKLNLTYRNGTFSNAADGVNILYVSYQLRFAADGVVNGYREGLIRQGATYDHARSQMTAIAGAATHVSGSTILRLSKTDSFHIRAFHTDASPINLVTASSGTKLTIAKL